MDFCVVKYASDGELVWVARYPASESGHNLPNDIALDRWENVYLAGGSLDGFTTIKFVQTETDIADDPGPLPDDAALLHAYPNPFNSSTTITAEGIEKADIGIFDITGRKVATLITEYGKAVWHAEGMSSGIYFARVLKSDSKSNIIKMIYLK
jgi:hypothetical protein